MELEDLPLYNIILAVDRSAKMGAPAYMESEETYYWAAEEAAIVLASKLKEADENAGITLAMFSDKIDIHENVCLDTIHDIFSGSLPLVENSQSANITKVVQHFADGYFMDKNKIRKEYEQAAKYIFLIIITSSIPKQEHTVLSAIMGITKNIQHDKEFVLVFLQGGSDQETHDFMKKLDNDLVREGAKYDIVNTRTYEEISSLADILVES